jgi:hypothetical protein
MPLEQQRCTGDARNQTLERVRTQRRSGLV